jgi:hypothetical protein
MSGAERRIGAVHALGMDAATLLFVGSLVARLRGGHRIGTKLAIAGNWSSQVRASSAGIWLCTTELLAVLPPT